MVSLMKRTTSLLFGAALLASALPVGHAVRAAQPASGSIDPTSPSVTWSGTAPVPARPVLPTLGDDLICVGPTDPTCDHYALTIDGPATGGHRVTITLAAAADSDDHDLAVFDEQGTRIATGHRGGDEEEVVLADPPDGTYTVSVAPFLSGDGRYSATAVLAAGSGTGTGTDSLADARIDDVVDECLEVVPASAGVKGVTDHGTTLDLDVHVQLDGIGESRARRVIAEAQVAYDEVGVRLDPVSFDSGFSAPSGGDVIDFNGKKRGSIDVDALFAAAKARLGGVRPPGTDIVLTLTNKDIGDDNDGDGDVEGTGVLGVADCIGGVRFAEHAFTIAEAWADRAPFTPAWETRLSGMVTAHEIGHLLGAHHHYGECATALRPHPANQRVSVAYPCTLMFPYAGYINLLFSNLSQSVVRGHTEDFAS